MADEKPQTVKVTAAQWHTYNGNEYDVGDTYDAPADLVASLAAQGKAFSTEAGAVEKAQARGSATAAKTGRSRKTTVAPMTTETVRPARTVKTARAPRASSKARK